MRRWAALVALAAACEAAEPGMVDAFYLNQHEVTNEQYAAFGKVTGHRTQVHWPQDRVPEGTGPA